MNLCECLSIRLFAVEQGLPSGDVPDWTGTISEPQRYAKTRTCGGGGGRGTGARVQVREVIDKRGAMMNSGK